MTVPTRHDRPVLAAIAVLLLLTGVWATWFWLALPGRLPSDDDYRAVNAHLKANASDGDVVVLAPHWATRGRDFLDAAPVFASRDLATDEYPDTKRQWLVSLADAPRVDLEALRNRLKTRASGTDGGTRLGGLWVEAFDVEGPVTLFGLRANVAQANVSLEGSTSEPCRWEAHSKRHVCARGGWNTVHDGWFDVGGHPFHALWAHPVDGAELVLKWNDVPLHGRLKLRGALTSLVALEEGEPVSVVARADGREVGRLDVRPPIDAPVEASFALPGADANARGTLELRVSARRAGRRHFALDAYVAAH